MGWVLAQAQHKRVCMCGGTSTAQTHFSDVEAGARTAQHTVFCACVYVCACVCGGGYKHGKNTVVCVRVRRDGQAHHRHITGTAPNRCTRQYVKKKRINTKKVLLNTHKINNELSNKHKKATKQTIKSNKKYLRIRKRKKTDRTKTKT